MRFTGVDQVATVAVAIGYRATPESAQNSYHFKLLASGVTEKLGLA